MDFETLRQFADTWGLLFLFVSFLAAVLWALRPGAGKTYEHTSRIPLNEDE
jgi:cytochrome c oxidase cbb3-type subunit 4